MRRVFTKERTARLAVERRYKKNTVAKIGLTAWRKRMYKVQLWFRYKITPKQRKQLIENQGGKCICGKKFSSEKDIHIDHNHNCCSQNCRSCGKCIRGVLCFRCNIVLGLYEKDTYLLPDYLKEYLKRPLCLF